MDLYKVMLEDRLWTYFRRVGGEVECEICGNPYSYHPYDQEILEFWPALHVHKLCNGILGKD